MCGAAHVCQIIWWWMHVPAIPGNTVAPLGDPWCQANQLTHQLSRSLNWLHLVYELAIFAILHCIGVRPACVSRGEQTQKSFIPPFIKGNFCQLLLYVPPLQREIKRQLLQQKASCLDSSKSSHSFILICLVLLSIRCKWLQSLYCFRFSLRSRTAALNLTETYSLYTRLEEEMAWGSQQKHSLWQQEEKSSIYNSSCWHME